MPKRFHASGRCGFDLASCAKAKSVREMWERIAPNDQQVSVIERYRQYFQEAGN